MHNFAAAGITDGAEACMEKRRLTRGTTANMMTNNRERGSVNDIVKAKKEGRGFYSNVRDPNLNWSKRGLNARTCTISLGQDGDLDAPVAAVVWLNSGPGDPLRGRHAHACDAINLVVEGGMYMDGIWLRPGQAKIVPADTNYGDATVTGEGCIFLEIFGDHHGARPVYDEPDEMAYWNEVHGNVLDR